jgi:signal transduction histidine kinase
MKEELLERRIELILNHHVSLFEAFVGLTEEFKKYHDEYNQWLTERITNAFNKRQFIDEFLDIGIDWVTLHYKTRHIPDGWSLRGEWVQAGLPLKDYMRRYEKKLKVYTGDQSPYISYFSRKISKSETPLQILFHEDNENELPEGWLCVRKKMVDYIVSITNDVSSQGDFSPEEIGKCMKIDHDIVESIRKEFSLFSSDQQISTVKALGMLRNACRVTLLALKQEDSEIKFPRVIVFAPVYTEGDNVIGGITFVGFKIIEGVDSKILKTLPETLLSSLRVREEGLRESEISYLSELNRARSDFIQRIAHSFQNPVDRLLVSVDELADSANRIKEAIKDLSTAAGDIMLAFSSRNVEDVLVVKKSLFPIAEFLKNLKLRNQKVFEAKGIQLEISAVPENWNLSADKTALWQAMNNLLDNARTFARQKVQIIVEKADSPARYLFHIIDDGPGIDPAIRGDLFKPGISGKKATNNKKSIHGFGLYISFRVVKKHGGELYINDDYTGGAEFIIELPG